MRKYLYVAIAVSALALVAPAAQARTATTHATPTARIHVLTIGKLGGRAVARGAKFEANLAKGTAASYVINGTKVKCLQFSSRKIVIRNPLLRAHVATLSNSSLKFGKCSISITGAKVTSVTAQNLPYNLSVSDAKGDPVTLSGRSASAPLSLTAVVVVGTIKLICTFTAPSIVGHFSNRTNKSTIARQPFTLSSGTKGCPPGPALFSVKLGPIRDVSVTGHPKVFVN